jgi:hypothetical protein
MADFGANDAERIKDVEATNKLFELKLFIVLNDKPLQQGQIFWQILACLNVIGKLRRLV